MVRQLANQFAPRSHNRGRLRGRHRALQQSLAALRGDRRRGWRWCGWRSCGWRWRPRRDDPTRLHGCVRPGQGEFQYIDVDTPCRFRLRQAGIDDAARRQPVVQIGAQSLLGCFPQRCGPVVEFTDLEASVQGGPEDLDAVPAGGHAQTVHTQRENSLVTQASCRCGVLQAVEPGGRASASAKRECERAAGNPRYEFLTHLSGPLPRINASGWRSR